MSYLSGNECVLPRLDRDFLVITDDKTWVSSDGGLSWQEKSSVRNIQLGLVPVSSFDNGTVVSGSFTVSRSVSSFYAQDIAYGNGKFLALGNANLQETMTMAVHQYIQDIKSGDFPNEKESY